MNNMNTNKLQLRNDFVSDIKRQFYCAFPIVNALRSQFNWYQYRLLIQIDNTDKREYYEQEEIVGNDRHADYR
jgi:hypothetical protein